MKQYSMRQQVAVLTFIPLLLMAIIMETYFMRDRFKQLDDYLLEKGELIAHQLAASSEYGVFSNNLTFLSDIANGALKQPDVRGVMVLNTSFEVLASVGEIYPTLDSKITNNALANIVRQQAFSSAEKMDQAIVLPTPENSDSLWLYHTIIPAQITLDDMGSKAVIKPAGGVIVEISRLRHEEQKMRMLWMALLVSTLILAIAGYLVLLASRSITRPIQKLSKAVDEIGAGNLDTRVNLVTHVRELATLAHGLNETTKNLQCERAELQHRIDEATQALREKKEAAERASHDKSHFLAVASHDLRQPLHALGLYVAELQRRVSGTDKQYLVEQIVHSIDAFSELLNALLDISKLDAGSIIPQLRTFSVDTMLKRIAADYQMMANAKNIRLIVRQCSWCVTSDPLLLERILVNLISNAIRYTDRDGKVMIACRKRGNFLRIEVRDNGSGISKIDQENIFREFFQVAHSQLDADKGLGLGLSIVDRLVKLLGHRIGLRSTPGLGSVFAIEVPLAPRSALIAASQARLEPVTEAIKSPFSGKRLLVVDDDPAVLSGTCNLLVSWGCQVSPAASLTEVDGLMHDGGEWDFIVSDYQLANNMNGVDVINRVRQHQGRQVPCIMVTGDTSPAVIELASMNGYPLLYKPIKPAKLRSLITRLLDESDLTLTRKKFQSLSYHVRP